MIYLDKIVLKIDTIAFSENVKEKITPFPSKFNNVFNGSALFKTMLKRYNLC